jgi:Kdo2-lipid IVA lauroyltransferase/acyltransferase
MTTGRRISNTLEMVALRSVVAFLRVLPWSIATRLGASLGSLGYRPLGIRRKVVERQVAGAFPDLPKSEVDRIAFESYRHLGRSTIETALLPYRGARGVLELVESVSGWEHMEAGLAAGKGVVLAAGHFGNWELLGSYLAARGVPIDAIVRAMANPAFDRYLNATREEIGMTVIYDRDAVRRTPRSLREGRVVAFVADQGVLGLASTFVPFFGRPAKTPRGAAVFALRFNAPVVFAVAVRKPSGLYHISVEPVEIEQTGDRDADVDKIVAKYTGILESWVRRYPEQYFWHHRRWRRQPPDTPPELRDPVAD